MFIHIRRALVFLGYKPWIRCCIVSVWNTDSGIAAAMYCTRDGYKDIYIEHGLKCRAALVFETKRITKNNFFIMDRSKLPIGRKYRDNWVANFDRKRIEVKL